MNETSSYELLIYQYSTQLIFQPEPINRMVAIFNEANIIVQQ